jgi:general secretion pathway protein D
MGGMTGMSGATGTTAAASGMMGMMGMGYGGFSAPRQDVGTKIKVIPHMNDSDEVRLELTEEISERGASSGTLGAVSITKRNAQTTVVVQDQQTVVIGGLMRDAVTRSDKKIPILGDIPVLGFLFRSSEKSNRKTNLLLVLTPYVIRDQNDLRRVFERKMQERQEFLDRYFVFSDQKDYEPPHDYSRANGLVEDIRQTYLTVDDRRRLEEETKPRDMRTHDAQPPIEMPLPLRAGVRGPAAGPPTAGPPSAAPAAGAPAVAPAAAAPAAPAPAAAPAAPAGPPGGGSPFAPPPGGAAPPSGGPPGGPPGGAAPQSSVGTGSEVQLSRGPARPMMLSPAAFSINVSGADRGP